MQTGTRGVPADSSVSLPGTQAHRKKETAHKLRGKKGIKISMMDEVEV